MVIFHPVTTPKNALAFDARREGLCMYLLTIRDGLQTRHIGPYASPRQASDDLDKLQASFGEKATWQIHRLESPFKD